MALIALAPSQKMVMEVKGLEFVYVTLHLPEPASGNPALHPPPTSFVTFTFDKGGVVKLAGYENNNNEKGMHALTKGETQVRVPKAATRLTIENHSPDLDAIVRREPEVVA